MLVQFIISGALVGFLVGATGVGGGSLMTPLLTLFFGVPAQVAVGTDLLFASITKTSGAISYARRGGIPWRIVLRLAAGSLPAAVGTLAVLNAWHPDEARFSGALRPILGGALLLTAGALLLRDQLLQFSRRLSAPADLLAGATAGGPPPALGSPAWQGRPGQTVAVGALIGTLVTLTSVGAGAIGVVALFLLYPMLAAQKLVGADIVHAVPLTLIAGLGHAALGTVDWAMLVGLLLGSLPAIHLGAALASRLAEDALRKALALMLVLVALRLLLA
jgi:hypothetical protein